MKHFVLRGVLATVALGGGEGIYTRGEFHRWLTTTEASLLAFLALLLSSAVAVIIRRRTAGKTIAALALLVLISLVPAYGFGRLIFRVDLAEAKRYAESFVPELDRIQATTGAYPRRVDSLATARANVPKLLNGCAHCFYSSDGSGYELCLLDPGIAGQSYVFKSEERRWREVFVPGIWF
jgi:hypothetical protein